MTVTINLYVFASLRNFFQEAPELSICLSKATWSNEVELKNYLLEILQYRRQLRNDNSTQIDTVDPNTFMLAIDECYVRPGTEITLNQGASVALIPPVSGG